MSGRKATVTIKVQTIGLNVIGTKRGAQLHHSVPYLLHEHSLPHIGEKEDLVYPTHTSGLS